MSTAFIAIDSNICVNLSFVVFELVDRFKHRITRIASIISIDTMNWLMSDKLSICVEFSIANIACVIGVSMNCLAMSIQLTIRFVFRIIANRTDERFDCRMRRLIWLSVENDFSQISQTTISLCCSEEQISHAIKVFRMGQFVTISTNYMQTLSVFIDW